MRTIHGYVVVDLDALNDFMELRFNDLTYRWLTFVSLSDGRLTNYRILFIDLPLDHDGM